MKSIYEYKRKLSCSEYPNSPNERRIYEDGIETGANYVLDEIEMLLPKEDKNLKDYGKALVWRIKDTIEQLKSNQ